MSKKILLSKTKPKLMRHVTASSKIDSKKKESFFAAAIDKDEIAIRAYFISERRRQLGWSGDANTDWLQAEQQLIAEADEKLKAQKK